MPSPDPTPNLDKRFGIELDMPSPVVGTEDELCIATDVGYNFGLPLSSLPGELDKCTGLQLKQALEAVEGVPCATQSLSFGGRAIGDGECLGPLGIGPGSQLQLDLALDATDASEMDPTSSAQTRQVSGASTSRPAAAGRGSPSPLSVSWWGCRIAQDLDAGQLDELERLEELARNIALSPTASRENAANAANASFSSTNASAMVAAAKAPRAATLPHADLPCTGRPDAVARTGMLLLLLNRAAGDFQVAELNELEALGTRMHATPLLHQRFGITSSKQSKGADEPVVHIVTDVGYTFGLTAESLPRGALGECTAGELKQSIERSEGVPAAAQRLLFGGVPLHDEVRSAAPQSEAIRATVL